MLHDDCAGCYYWDYIDDTSESDAKMCYYNLYQKSNGLLKIPACVVNLPIQENDIDFSGLVFSP